MRKTLRLLGLLVAYAAFALMVGYFSTQPVYHHVPSGNALIKMNFSHAGQPKQECRQLTQEELDQLAPNMRKPLDCPRERVPLLVELSIDGDLRYRGSVPPTGVAGDGAATVYQKFQVPGGRHQISVRMRDSRRGEGFDYAAEHTFDLAAGRILVIDFEAETGGFKFL